MIETLSKDNIAEFLPLIRKYQEFYKVHEISDDNNARFFSQFDAANPLGCIFLYRKESTLAGFATVYFTYASTITAKVATLNDLYTLPLQRKNGIAQHLIKHCQAYAKREGAERLQWVTSPDNRTAQSLYDALDTQKSTWHFYTYPVA
ncbi:MAG: GNAT family N-acetyltransferase [Agarilytica sp.]